MELCRKEKSQCLLFSPNTCSLPDWINGNKGNQYYINHIFLEQLKLENAAQRPSMLLILMLRWEKPWTNELRIPWRAEKHTMRRTHHQDHCMEEQLFLDPDTHRAHAADSKSDTWTTSPDCTLKYYAMRSSKDYISGEHRNKLYGNWLSLLSTHPGSH